MNKFIFIIGSGISGTTIARKSAILGHKVIVIEKRNHIGGNCYDYYDRAGILVPKYGPHFFHTNDKEVWDYVSQFTEWIPYEHRVLANVDGKNLVSVPVNISTVNKLFKLNIKTEEQMKQWLIENTEKITNPKNSEEAALRRVGHKLYEMLFKGYTKKQWDLLPVELGPEVMDRIPVRTNQDDRYFTDTYQGMPKDGYTKIFERILDHPNITVKLNTDYFVIKDSLPKFDRLFFTGPIDQFFQYKFGDKLQYRSLFFKYETHDKEYFQTRAQINYPNTEQYTRITEPKHATGQKHNKTTIIKEYSTWDGEPYYPVPSERNKILYEKYQKEALKLEKKGVYFVGRLANYKYLNMDQAFKNALNYCHEE